ncbi:uncharacterized protein [Argopecten irradians]|uniref:uncharacterized protein n=1 Tax=Argopecten irradians TaxID=31199 RepID=UPI0037144DD7
MIRIPNNTLEPQMLRKHEHFCQVSSTVIKHTSTNSDPPIDVHRDKVVASAYNTDSVQLDPDNILPDYTRQAFRDKLHLFDNLFDPNFRGYNGAAGKFEAHINMGPANLLKEKPNGGFRLVTAFEDVGRYSKPQPSLMPDVDSTLRTIAQWKYIIVTDLTSAFYQIPLSKASMKYCGVVTPFRGVCVYRRCAMGMPGSETALEEMMCRVLGDCLQDGIVAKLADDLYCGGDTPEQLLGNWSKVMECLQRCDLRLSSSKTVVCPRSTTILGWIWSQGHISASPHRVAVLATCKRPETAFSLRSFLGAYKMLGRVVPHCSQILAPLEEAVAGLQSKDKINWTDQLEERFSYAQESLSSNKAIALPTPSDVLWIVTDGSVSKHGIGATLYIMRANQLSLAGFFSAKLRKHQVTWLPCEIEALCIAAAVKHYSPYIIQSKHQTCVLTDSQPCVQAINKLARGEFSASPRVTSFLTTVSRYQGTRPSKKLTNIKDVKRYLTVTSIAKDGLVVVRRNDPLQPSTELIVVPRSVLDGLVTALHIKLDHPSRHQMQLVMKRHFYGLDMNSVIARACDSCHMCASLKKLPRTLIHQSSEQPPDAVGVSFAADVLRRNRQLILLLRETTTSYTSACLILDEKRETLRDGLLRLALELHPLDGPHAIIRVDPAPGFMSLRDDTILHRFRIEIEVGRIKNINKNPVAERAIAELEDELLRQEPGGGPVTELALATAVARLNSRIRGSGLSARECWTQRSQFTHDQLPISDRDNIIEQNKRRETNHRSSEKSKYPKHRDSQTPYMAEIKVGDLVYLYTDRDKTKARNRYLVVSIPEGSEWCFIKKFTGNQLRSSSYKVKLSTASKPPTPVDIPPLLSTPATTVPPTRDSPDIPILVGESDSSTCEDIPPVVNTPSDESTCVKSDNDVPPLTLPEPTTRPRRHSRPPKYLNDYDLS